MKLRHGWVLVVILLALGCDRGSKSKGGGPGAGAPSAKQTLADARKAYKTHVFQRSDPTPPPQPPPDLFKLVKYPSPAGELAAYVSKPRPSSGSQQPRHPAIIWIFGGFGNDIGETAWADQPASNDQSARAFWKAGIVTMYPSFRGGCANPGAQEVLYGEADDVLAAAEYLAKQPDVDPARIYLGGHSTGGTLALLVAELAPPGRFRAIFPSGPIDDVAGYGADEMPFDTGNASELRPRSPIHWLDGITTPTFVFEGAAGNSNLEPLLAMKRATRNRSVQFFPVAGATHFSVLRPLTRLIADKILADAGPTPNIAFTFDETNQLMLKNK